MLECITYSKRKSYFVQYFSYVWVPLLGYNVFLIMDHGWETTAL